MWNLIIVSARTDGTRDTFVMPSMLAPRCIAFQGDLGFFQVTVHSPVSVGQFLQAERQLAGPGWTYLVLDQGRSLDDSAMLHQQSEAYEVRMKPKRQAKSGVPVGRPLRA